MRKSWKKDDKEYVEESARDNCITNLEEQFLQKTAVDENQDIVNAYFQKRVKTLWNEVLQPILGGKHYIMRYEFQHLGTIHCHMVTSLENGPTLGEMDIARFDLPEYPNVSDWTKNDGSTYKTKEEKETGKTMRQEQYEKDVQKYNDIKA